MNRDHTLIEELLSVRALGGLDGDDVDALEREMSAHGDCEECRRLEDGFGEVAGRLAFSLQPASVHSSGADAILARAREERPQRRAQTIAARALEAEEPVRRRVRRRTLAAAVAVAAALVLGAVAVVTIGGSTPVTTASQAQRILRLTGTAGGARVAIAYTPSRPGIVLLGADVPNPGPGKTYELWTIRNQTPISAGCVVPTDGRIAVALPATPAGGDLMAVTVESVSCPSAPTTTPILTAPIA